MTVRALDNALELSIDRYSVRESALVMSAKRKIGVGICGVADMLANLGIPYDSDQGRSLCKDMVAFINFQTKVASMDLAKVRGSFGAMNMGWGCRYNDNPGFIEDKYGQLDTNTVSSDQWRELGQAIRQSRMLRNCSTIALPPTGRSGLVISASTGVEPLFTLLSDGEVHKGVIAQLQKTGSDTDKNLRHIKETGSCQQTDVPSHVKDCLRTATEIDPQGHLKMVSAIQPCVDESISKTINLPSSASVQDVMDIYLLAYESGLKGMTVYRDGSSNLQPRKVVS